LFQFNAVPPAAAAATSSLLRRRSQQAHSNGRAAVRALYSRVI